MCVGVRLLDVLRSVCKDSTVGPDVLFIQV